MKKWKLKFTLLLTALIPGALPQALASEERLPTIECKEDSDGRGTYNNLGDAKKREVEADFPLMTQNGISTQHRNKMVSDLRFAYNRICKKKKAVQDAADALKAKAETAKVGSCNAFQTFESDYYVLQANSVDYAKEAAKERDSLTDSLVKGLIAEQKEIADKGKQNELKASFEGAWGRTIDKAKWSDENLQRSLSIKGKISSAVLGFQGEVQASELRKREFQALHQSVSSVQGKCTSLTGDPAAPGSRIPDSPTGPGGQLVQRTSEGPYDSPGPAPGTSSVGQWASDNKELLIVGGAGVAGVAGILYYKKQQDNKEKNEQARYDAAVAEITAARNGSGGGGGEGGENSNPNAPSENRSLHITGAPSSAKVDKTLNPIAVSIRDKDGNPVQESGATITVSCTSSCSLTGTLSRTTNNGLAEFNDLRFTGAHTGVQLRFESSGLNSVTTPGSFNVSQ